MTLTLTHRLPLHVKVKSSLCVTGMWEAFLERGCTFQVIRAFSNERSWENRDGARCHSAWILFYWEPRSLRHHRRRMKYQYGVQTVSEIMCYWRTSCEVKYGFVFKQLDGNLDISHSQPVGLWWWGWPMFKRSNYIKKAIEEEWQWLANWSSLIMAKFA